MEHSVTCQCGKRYKIPDNAAGKRFRCKACGAVIAVPAPPADEASSWEDALQHAAADAASAPPVTEAAPVLRAGPPPAAGQIRNLSVDQSQRLKVLGYLAGGIAALGWFAGVPLYRLNSGAEHVHISISGIVCSALLTAFAVVALAVGGTVLPWKKTGPRKPVGLGEKLAIGAILVLTILIVGVIWLYFNSHGYTISL